MSNDLLIMNYDYYPFFYFIYFANHTHKADANFKGCFNEN